MLVQLDTSEINIIVVHIHVDILPSNKEFTYYLFVNKMDGF